MFWKDSVATVRSLLFKLLSNEKTQIWFLKLCSEMLAW